MLQFMQMKLLFLLICIAIIATFAYYCSFRIMSRNKKHRGINQKAIGIAVAVVMVLLGFVIWGMYRSATAPDTHCTTYHATTSYPPVNLTTAMDYFMQGNYDYDRGNCTKAISDYTASIGLNPDYPQAYNNRAYTYMRMQKYQNALPDLDKAIALNPTYIQALMNRGDIHNYYFAIDRQSAIADYEKVISLGGTQQSTSVCGHLFLAKHNGWNLGTILDFPKGAMICR